MSSHHFVREDQEPGLLIYDWFENTHQLIDQLAQWAPKIIVHEKVLDLFLLHGYKADVVLYSTIENEVREKVDHQYPIELLESRGSLKDDLIAIQENLIDRFNVIGSVTYNDVDIISKGIVFYTEDKYFHRIEKGFQKWMSKEATFTIVEKGVAHEYKGENELFTYDGSRAYFSQNY